MPTADQLGELALLRQEGKIRHIGVSEATVDQLEEARSDADVVSVQNLVQPRGPQCRGRAAVRRVREHRLHPVVPHRTSSVAHLDENVRAAETELTDDEFEELTKAV